MPLNRWQGISAALGVLAALAAGGCTTEPQPPLRVGTNVWPGYEPLYLARELGFYHDTEVRLVEYSSATQVIQAWRNSAIDAAALTLDEVLRLAEDGHRPRVVAVLDISNGADALLARAPITRLGQLRGRRIGVEDTAVGGYLLGRALQQAGLARTAVRVVPLQFHRHEPAFVRGEIDAVVTFEPVRSRLLARGAHVLFDSRRIPGEIVDVLVVRPEALDRQPQRVRHLVGGWLRACRELERDRPRAARLMAPRLQLSPAEFLASLDGLRLPDLAENHQLLGGRSPAMVGPARRLAAEMLAQRLLRAEIDVAALPEAQFLPAASP